MASSAFKSTTRRTTVGGSPAGADDSSGSSSNKAHRRSRSLSRFSHGPRRFEEPAQADLGYNAAPRGKFVNTTRGSGVPEISLDDLAIEFFSQEEERENSDRGRSGKRASGIGHWASETASSTRRGRSVSRQGSKTSASDRKSVTADRSRSNIATSDASSRRRRSVSAVRYQISDSESDADHFRNSSSRIDIKKNQSIRLTDFPSSLKPTTVNSPQLRRSFSQKDMSQLHDGYSSHSSALTDDDTKDALTCKNGIEKTIRAVYAQKKGEHPNGDVVNGELYEAMRKELRHAVEEIKTELEQTMGKKISGAKSGHEARKNHVTKLEQEDQRGRADTKNSVVAQKQPRRKRSNDRNRTSKQLNEEAEKFFEDFIANIEDTDFSSFDGERSDASSTLGGIAKPRDSFTYGEAVNQSPAGANCHPVGTDGVILPWLQWETSNDGSFTPKNEVPTPVSRKTSICDARQDVTSPQNDRSYSISSHGSWSPAILHSQPKNRAIYTVEDGGDVSGELESCQSSGFDMAEYNRLQRSEELLFERYRERNRISLGGLLLCGHFL
ncbi:uncharacterized protein LOC107786377 [Nicotiana tabacum]|uniref:Uncharacterized protein LOC107786377 n=1 Tax=Nicotiana tabacum TaxID=4097 RepID=A0A1S3ZGC5_TOBAC|nr:uncharacterized protein LOC104108679 [Nicotiana tomentosiformis]XP_016463332.1 PREDICTED: uncharacterized protein LOC107786377 [Nicotiana tabacum]XP_033515178.1 uncharacterized protein LOC104108679 [Nicotiana tomentosiformis]